LSNERERFMLHRFRRRAYPHIGRTMTAGEAIFLARHYGLPTRLLDWTANALFALYFACAEHPDSDGKVWAMRRRPGIEKELDVFDLVTLKSEENLFKYLKAFEIKMVYPLYNSPRLVAQDGAFTIHSKPTKSIEEYEGKPFKKEALDLDKLYWWLVPKE